MGCRVVVAGGGIGGAAAALALARVGAEVTVLERSATVPAAGTAIALYPNGLAVLHGLGLGERLEAGGHQVRTAELCLDGRLLLAQTFADHGAGLDHLLVLRRSLLAEAMYAAMAADSRIDVRFGTVVTAARPDGALDVRPGPGDAQSPPRGHPVPDRVGTTGTGLGTATGAPDAGPPGHGRTAGAPVRAGGGIETLRADLVVGADGVDSRVRAGGRFGARQRRLRSVSLRLVVPGRPWGDRARESWTRWGICLTSPVDPHRDDTGPGAVATGTYLAASASHGPLADALARVDVRAIRSILATMLPGAADALRDVPDDGVLIRWADEVRTRRWVDGRLVLLGDAAHAMSPHLGQGANTALLDALALAEELAPLSRTRPTRGGTARGATAVEDALAAYARRRRRPAMRVHHASRVYEQVCERWTGPVPRAARDQVMRAAVRLVPDPGAHLGLVLQRDPAEALAATRLLSAAPAR